MAISAIFPNDMARQPGQKAGETRTRILDTAETLVQKRGFNGFSYADIAMELGVTPASLHYHFAGKAALGKALISRYAARFAEALAAIEARFPDGPSRLEAYANLYAAVLRRKRLCLCGMLAAEYETLPKPMRDAIKDFFDENEVWLGRVLESGRDDATLAFIGYAGDAASMIVSGLEGGMLVARPYGKIDRFQSTARQLISTLLPQIERTPPLAVS